MARLKETIDNEFVEVHKNMQAIKKEMEEAASRSIIQSIYLSTFIDITTVHS